VIKFSDTLGSSNFTLYAVRSIETLSREYRLTGAAFSTCECLSLGRRRRAASFSAIRCGLDASVCTGEGIDF